MPAKPHHRTVSPAVGERTFTPQAPGLKLASTSTALWLTRPALRSAPFCWPKARLRKGWLSPLGHGVGSVGVAAPNSREAVPPTATVNRTVHRSLAPRHPNTAPRALPEAFSINGVAKQRRHGPLAFVRARAFDSPRPLAYSASTVFRSGRAFPGGHRPQPQSGLPMRFSRHHRPAAFVHSSRRPFLRGTERSFCRARPQRPQPTVSYTARHTVPFTVRLSLPFHARTPAADASPAPGVSPLPASSKPKQPSRQPRPMIPRPAAPHERPLTESLRHFPSFPDSRPLTGCEKMKGLDRR